MILALLVAAQLDRAVADASRLEQAGRAGEALAAYRTALAGTQSADPLRARIFQSMAAIEVDAGEYAPAIRHANEAARLYAAQGDPARQAVALNYAGLAHLYRAEYDAASAKFTTAIALSAKALDASAQAEEVTNLANVQFFVGRYADAATNYAAAMKIAAAHPGEPWTLRRRRLILGNEAALHQKLGRDEQALALYRQMQASGTELRPREQGQILMNLGVLYRRLGDPIKALAAYEEALTLFAREQQVNSELAVMKNRGIVLALDLGQLAKARENFSQSLDRATKANSRREMMQARLYRAETELRLEQLDAAKDDFSAALEASRALKTPEEEWKALYGLGRVELRAGSPDAAVQRLNGAIDVIESIREVIRVPALRSDFFSDKREVYDLLTSVQISRAAPATIFDLIERGHSRLWRDRLGLAAPVTLSAVQRVLPPGVMLMDMWSSADGSAIVSVTRDHAEIRQVNVDAAVVARLVDALSAGPGSDWRRAAETLGSQLLPQPPAGDIRHIIIVPDGPLALVPFEVLPVRGKMLIQQVAVTYAPTAAMLLRPRPKPRLLRPPWALQLQAFGNPVSAPSPLETARGTLAGSEAEVRSIASELGGRAVLHLGADDQKRWLLDTNFAAPVLHIASHAVADTEATEQSRIFFSPAPRSTTADYLFLKEAYGLSLHNVDLVVLSACETERGHLVRGEGVQSFSRAFLAAGAQSAVTTLWKVPDAPTAAFMRVFYHHLQQGQSRAEALRAAKLKFLSSNSDLRDPHYWAAFILNGEGTQPVPHALHWTTVAFAAALIVLAGVAVVWMSRSSAIR